MSFQDNSQVYRVIDIFYHGIVISNQEKVMRLSDYDLTVKDINSEELFKSIHPGDETVNKYKHIETDKKITGGDHNDYQSHQLVYSNEGKNIKIMETHPEQTDITKWSVNLHPDNPNLTIGSEKYNEYYSKGKPITYYTLRLNDTVLVDLTKSIDKKIWISYVDKDKSIMNSNSFSRFLFDVKEYPIVRVADNVIIMNGKNEYESKSIFLSRDVRTGLYRVAGGHVEKGESNKQGAKRESGEETRLSLKAIEKLEYKMIEVERRLLSNIQESRRGVVLYSMKDLIKNMDIDTVYSKISFEDQNNIIHNLTWDTKNAFPKENSINQWDNTAGNEITLSYYTEDVLIETIERVNKPDNKLMYHYFKHNYLLYEHGNDKHLYRAVGDLVDKHTMTSTIIYRYLNYNEEMKSGLYTSGDPKEPLESKFLSIEEYNELKDKNLFHWNTHIGLIDRGILYASEIIMGNKNEPITMNTTNPNNITFRTNKIGEIFVAYNSTIPKRYDYDFYIRRNIPHNNTHYYIILDSDVKEGDISIDDAMVNLKNMLNNKRQYQSLFAIELLSDIADGMCYIKRLIKVPDNIDKKYIADSKQEVIKRAYDSALKYYEEANEYYDLGEHMTLDYILLFDMLINSIRSIKFLLSIDNIDTKSKGEINELHSKAYKLKKVIEADIYNTWKSKYGDQFLRNNPYKYFDAYYRTLVGHSIYSTLYDL
jgi:hypothetical protein